MLERQVGQLGSGQGFEVVFVTEAGVERRVPWEWLPDVVGELQRPVRSFPSYRGQRNFSGWYWSATLGRRIGFESWVERDHLVALDFDASVVGIVSQPFWLVWTPDDGKQRRHAPDFLVRSVDG
ncbi:TnsA-like heteromeric transposase endonuclease subunit [Nocardia sp. 2YAB30]|uniref:TnsA-like heteromeric transposase endonuclease subunit n=1 Tax=unclassified Nocardia TaxID=2637762 RepID=UPI003F985538